GYPDRIFWLPGGRPLLVEFKQPGEPLELKQVHHVRELLDLGYLVEVHDNAERAFLGVARAVDSTQLSSESRQVLAAARRRWAVPRPWFGEDGYRPNGLEVLAEAKGRAEGADRGAAARLLQHLAGGDRQVGGLQWNQVRGPARARKGRAA